MGVIIIIIHESRVEIISLVTLPEFVITLPLRTKTNRLNVNRLTYHEILFCFRARIIRQAVGS